jgi:hypothetical protein
MIEQENNGTTGIKKEGSNNRQASAGSASDESLDISLVSAQALLDSYSRHEQPKGMYSEKLQSRQSVPVDKDW